MAAKDYEICCGWRNAYIARIKKQDSGVMSQDRREISEPEVLAIIHWWAQKKAEENGSNMQAITHGGKRVVEITLLEEE